MRTSFPVDAPPGAWAAIADPGRLAAALPGCRSVTRDDGGDGDGGGTLHVVTDVAVASVRGLWAGTVARLDADAVRVRGSGAPGTVDLVVRADPDRTAVTVEGTVEGPLATVGSAVLAAAVCRTAKDLLAALAAAGVAGPARSPASASADVTPAPAASVRAASAAAPPVPARPAASASADPSADDRRRRRLRLVVGAAALGAAVVLGRRLVDRSIP